MTPSKAFKRPAQATDPPGQLDQPRPRKVRRTSKSDLVSNKDNSDPTLEPVTDVSVAAASQNLALPRPCRLADCMHDLECMLADIVDTLQTSGGGVIIEETELKRLRLARVMHEAGLERTRRAQIDQQGQHAELLTMLARADAG